MAGEDQEAVDLGAMPRQHRRRREKKLMTIDEVNEKFPLTKYKTWRSNRAEEGLPTAGGINPNSQSRPQSRPQSIREFPRESKETNHEEVAQLDAATPANEKQPEHGAPEIVEEVATREQPSSPRPKTAQSSTAPNTPVQKVETNDEEGEDEDQIQTAVPAEQLPDPGDTCAICIDTIEDDDDVRGLHCGHAFHASCVDPWLTSRRACCPLCKADYYVPKPRPEGAEAEDARRRGLRVDGQPAPPQFAFMGNGRRPTLILPGRFMSIGYDQNSRHGFPSVIREPRPPQPSRAERRQQRREEQEREREASLATTADVERSNSEQPTAESTWRTRWTNIRIPRYPMTRRHVSNDGTRMTPAQVEEGRA